VRSQAARRKIVLFLPQNSFCRTGQHHEIQVVDRGLLQDFLANDHVR
jgi:hypothetical protein